MVVRPVLEELERAGAGFLRSEAGALEALVSGYDDRDLALLADFMKKANAFTRAEIARVRAASGGNDGDGFSAPLGSVEGGRLVFANGAARLTLRADPTMDGLYRARFEGAPPKVAVEGGTVTFRRSRRFTLFDSRRHSEEVTLNTSVPWEIEVRGGAAQIEADLARLVLSSFVLKGGVSELDLTLPEPSGTVPIRLSGGASKVNVRRPAGVEARMDLKGGASKLAFDGQSFEAVGGTVRLRSTGYDGLPDRYDIEVSGGASEVSVR